MSVLYKCTACEASKVLDEEVESALICPACGADMELTARSKAKADDDGDGEGKYKCECIECGYKMSSDKHCNELKCPKCGGEMRRQERPGPGRGIFPEGLKQADVVAAKASVQDVDRQHKTMVVRISTDDLDRDQEVLLPKGCDLAHFRANPVVLAMHDHSALPIGKSLWEKVRAHDILAKPQFHPVANYDLPQIMFDLYADDVLKAWSVGFMPKSGGLREPTEDDLKARPDWAGVRGIYTDWELWEYSAVPVPSNPEALALAVKSGTKSIPGDLLDLMDLPDIGEAYHWQKPYPNEHACRLRDPGDFEADSFRRTSREHEGKKYSVIMGRLKGQTTLTEQTYRYPTDAWDVSSARAHCKDHNGILFEPAKDVRDASSLATCKVRKLMTTRKPIEVVRAVEVRMLTNAALSGRVTVED